MVSSNLESILNYKNYDILKQLIVPLPTSILNKRSRDQFDNNNNSSSCNQFKLIQNNTLIRVVQDHEQDNNKDNKLINNISVDSVNFDLENLKKFESNCELNGFLHLNQNNLQLLSGAYSNRGYIFNGFKNRVNHLAIKLDGELEPEQELEMLNNLLIKVNPNKLFFCSEELLRSYSELYKSNTLESLSITSTDYYSNEPKDISMIDNNNTKLKSLSLMCNFNSITRYVNNKDSIEECGTIEDCPNCDYYKKREFYYQQDQMYQNEDGGVISGEQTNQNDDDDDEYSTIQNEWKSMFNTLSNNSTIKDLILSEACVQNECELRCVIDDDLDTSFVCNGLASIFTSSSSRIENLYLRGLELNNNDIFYSALSTNTTIKTLVLDLNETQVNKIFLKVLSKSRTIRNVVLDSISISQLELLFSSLGQSLDLYSLTALLYEDENIFNLFNLITKYNKSTSTLNQFKVKEITIYYQAIPGLSNNRIKSRMILNNNTSTIINFISLKERYDHIPSLI